MKKLKKKLKKFIEKIRCWFIKKLGGYTSQFPPTHTTHFKYIQPEMKTLQGYVIIPNRALEGLYSSDEVNEKIYSYIAGDLLNQIAASDALKVVEVFGPDRVLCQMEKQYRWALRVAENGDFKWAD